MSTKKLDMKDIQRDMVKWRRDLHKIPELGIELPQTVAYISSVLDEIGIEYKYLMNKNAIVAEIKGREEGKVIGLRADMDGLPVVEETGLDFASTNGNMHACGHDGHAAMLLGAAKYLNSRRDEFAGVVKLLFQPGEESPGGAKPMLQEGAFENPKVDAVFGIHEGNIGYGKKSGQVLFKKGTLMASANTFEIKITGRGVHAAYPHMGIDPIPVAAELVLAFQSIVSRGVSAIDTAVVSVTGIQSGSTHNVIPEDAIIMGTVRTFDKEIVKFVTARMQEICKGLAIAHNVDINIDFVHSYPPTINDFDFTEFAYNVAKSMIGDDAIYMQEPIMAAEDMSYFLENAKGTYAFLVNPAKIDGIEHPHHHPKFDVDEKYFEQGASLHAKLAIEFLNS